MYSFEENETLYTDIIMQLFSSYIISDSNNEIITNILESSMLDPEIEGPGLFPGMLYACIVHMSLLLQTLSKAVGQDRESLLKTYALAYSTYRQELSNLPQLRPEFVNDMMYKFLNKDK